MKPCLWCRRDVNHFFKVIVPAARAPSLARCNAAPLANLSQLAAPGLASLDNVLCIACHAYARRIFGGVRILLDVHALRDEPGRAAICL